MKTCTKWKKEEEKNISGFQVVNLELLEINTLFYYFFQ
jgi:hypothetical protein